jgi:hypothetical protein
VKVGEREVAISNPGKPLFPEARAEIAAALGRSGRDPLPVGTDRRGNRAARRRGARLARQLASIGSIGGAIG